MISENNVSNSPVSVGLSTQEAAQRLARDGLNALPDAPSISVFTRFIRQFLSPLIYVLLAALAVDAFLWGWEGFVGVPLEALTILFILVANAILGVWQESKSERALERIKALSAPQASVMRDGALRRIAVSDIVVGDVIRLASGDRVPADGIVTSCDLLAVDESLLTGESLPVEKAGEDEVFSGTVCVKGNGFAQVTAVGLNSSMGKLASLLSSVISEKSPLEKRLTHFGNQVAVVVLVLAVVILVSGVWVTGGAHFSTIFLFAVALAVAAVPESLPAVLTLTMAFGVERMAARKAVVRRLSAVEALGSVTVIATDKTGTLTENKMQVERLELAPDIEEEAHWAMLMANDADPETGVGDPMDTGLLLYLQAHAKPIYAKRGETKKLAKKPFDSAWKYMRVSVQRQGEVVHYIKGAPDVLMAMCDLTESQRAELSTNITSYASEGFRMLALAAGTGDNTEQHLRWLGLVLFWDPPRQEVPEAIRLAQAAGIRVLMITGDHPETARTIAERIGIHTPRVLTGAELDKLTESEKVVLIQTTNVFARVRPEHKLYIVNCLKAQKEIVAMTGDGANDAPALKAADVGIAMGQRGSDVSREVADLVLLDDNFATIVDAIAEGRSIYENIQKFIRTLFSTNLSECLLIGGGALFAFTLAGLSGSELILPLTAVQILWINLLTDSLPALAITTDQNRNMMQLPPRKTTEPLLDSRSMRFIFSLGFVGGLVSLGALFSLPSMGFSAGITQSWIFSFVVLIQLSFVLPARQVKMVSEKNLWVLAAILLCLVLQLLAIFLPSFHGWLGIESLPMNSFIIMCLIALCGGFFAHLYAGYLRRSRTL